MLSHAESVARAALYPKMELSGVIALERVIADFKSVTDESGQKVYVLSVGSDTLLPTWEAKHDFGRRVAAAANAFNLDLALKNDATFVRQFYRGSYIMSVKGICDASNEHFDLSVHLTPLPGLAEHCDIEMRRTTVEARKAEVSASRTRVISQLRLLLSDPHEHICDDDMEHAEILEKIRLIGVHP